MGPLNFYASMLHTNMLRMMKALRKTGLVFDEHIFKWFHTSNAIFIMYMSSLSGVITFWISHIYHFHNTIKYNKYITVTHIFMIWHIVVISSFEVNTVNERFCLINSSVPYNDYLAVLQNQCCLLQS